MKNAAPTFGEDYFGQYYADYERQNPPGKMKFYRCLAEQCVGNAPRARLLDVGCAFGKFLAAANPSWERFGSDVSEFAIARAQASFPDIAFCVSSATELPFEGLFDVITAFDTIEHVSALDQVANAVRGKLQARGHFIFVVPVYDGLTGPFIRLLDKDPTHVHKCSRDFWLQWTESNFQLLEWWGIFRYLFPGGYYLHAPTRLLRQHTPAIAVTAQKK